jgi:pimeloyl-ACP methyl ester carboxylesterase
MKQARLERANLQGIELEYEVQGTGEELVVLVHHGVGVDWFRPLLEEPALTDNYRVLSYHRVGYGGSSGATGPLDFEQEAAHCRSLMGHLGVERAHVVGHSASAMIALQLALDNPDAVHTLALLESARPALHNEQQTEFVSSAVRPALELYGAGDKAGAVDTWLRGVGGSDYRPALDRALPEAFDQAVASADTFFGHELPAVQKWAFTQEDADRVTQPALLVLRERTDPIFRERREVLLEWLPNAEPFELSGATHLLHVENPRGMAEALAAFFARHPLEGVSGE